MSQRLSLPCRLVKDGPSDNVQDVELVREDELRYGQFGRLVVVPAEAPIGTHAGWLGQSDRYGRMSEPRFELAFQCHRLEVNPTVRSDVMPVLLKSGMSASRDKVVEEMNGMSIVGAPLVAIEGDARTWAEPISRTT
ncbi:hypothetical protein F2Q69_00043238 [Brassica cretica]|uniref:Uncharacterized protein n=1 Tax=Brassica cretica TaxID=69181 RepID=A0A8S9NM62_BRACR|nr:hypothetical protein F2Q69_00043238 [Brassica cretica]